MTRTTIPAIYTGIMEERWAPFPIEQFELTHEISDHGRVRTKDRYVWKGNGKGYRHFFRGRVLAPSLMKIGYYRARPNNYTELYIHRLVALAFVPNPENLPDINHKDLNKQNNHWTNLEWVTHKQNMHHAMQAKLTRRQNGQWQWRKNREIP